MTPAKAALSIALLAALAGCGEGGAQKPPDAAPVAQDSAPAKTPTTPEEKIAAIEKSSMPADQKKQAIEQVRSGKL